MACGFAARCALLERTRHLPIIVIVQPGEEARLLRALDMGVNDYLTRPVDRNELLARVRTQIKRKRHADYLRGRLEESVELAVTDPLTGLHNRRYMETHLAALAEQARASGRPLSRAGADIDNFKSINDTYGHDAGDSVLREFASPLPPQYPRHRSGLPYRRRGIRHRHARHGLGARLPGRRAPAGVHRRRAVPGRRRHAACR